MGLPEEEVCGSCYLVTPPVKSFISMYYTVAAHLTCPATLWLGQVT